jgi:hypothetical protein
VTRRLEGWPRSWRKYQNRNIRLIRAPSNYSPSGVTAGAVRSRHAVAPAAAAQWACADLDNERAGLYLDLIHFSLSEAARRALHEMLPANYEYQSDFARKYYGQGKTEGKAEGSREALSRLIARLLGLRFGPLDDAALSRIAVASTTELEQIGEHSLTAPTLEAALSVVAAGPGIDSSE